MNREFVVTYSLLAKEPKESEELKDQCEVYILKFRTMKHFSDWFNEERRPIIILSIVEVEGDSRYNKYFVEWITEYHKRLKEE